MVTESRPGADCGIVRLLAHAARLVTPAAHKVRDVIQLSSDDEEIHPRRRSSRKLAHGKQQFCNRAEPERRQGHHSGTGELLSKPEIVELFCSSSEDDDVHSRRKRTRTKGLLVAGTTVHSDQRWGLTREPVATTTTIHDDFRSSRGFVCELCKKANVTECRALGGCSHRFCDSCLADHALREVNETINPPADRVKNVMPGLILCPSLSGCSRELSRQEVLSVIGEQETERYESWLVASLDKIYSGQRGSCSTTKFTRCIREACRALTICSGSTGTGNILWQCSNCKGRWCSACGRQFRYSNPDVHATCTGSRRDELYLELLNLKETWQEFVEVTGDSSRKQKKKSKKKGGGVGYGGSAADFSTEQAESQRKEQEFHRQMEKHFRALRRRLDGCSSPGRINSATWALLRREDTLATVLSHMLSNDSILDMSWKSSCYLELMGLLTTMGSHDGLLPQILLGMGHKSPHDEPVVISRMANLYQQSKLMLSRLPDQGRNMADADADIQLALKLCESYDTLKDQLAQHARKQQAPPEAQQAALEVVPAPGVELKSQVKGRGKGKGKESSCHEVASNHGGLSENAIVEPVVNIVETYKKKLQPLQFRSVALTDKAGVYRSTYVHDITDRRNDYTNRGRMLAIAKELASLATSLPLEWGSSIYLCVDEVRADVMKALIVGPHGTPYQNGMFIFDVFLPADYPNVPPKVHFLTTGGGKVRFNPNLYATGFVCLSLLGTWQFGPAWMPGKSTLLQALVSIQSLIFVEQPYYNEPGRESRVNVKAAESDNACLRNHTMSIALLAALRKPEALFAEVILEHFRYKRAEVEEQLTDWVGKGASQQVANDITKEFRRLYDR